MKSSLAILILVVTCSCSTSSDPTPTSQINLRLQTLTSVDGVTTLSYDDQGRLETIGTNGSSTELSFFYLTDDIQAALTGEAPTSIKNTDDIDNSESHVYGTTVVNGNPVEIRGIEKIYVFNPNTGGYTESWEEMKVKITYDNKFNPLYLVLEQSQMLPTINTLILNSPDPLYTQLNASGLIAVNNPVKIEVFDEDGTLTSTTTIIYSYNAQGLPTKAVATADGDTSEVDFGYVAKN